MPDRKCETCQHWGRYITFQSWHMDYCNREDSVHYSRLMNRDSYCDAWEPIAECAGCFYWDGDDGRCRNGNSQRFMQETDDGCEHYNGDGAIYEGGKP